MIIFKYCFGLKWVFFSKFYSRFWALEPSNKSIYCPETKGAQKSAHRSA